MWRPWPSLTPSPPGLFDPRRCACCERCLWPWHVDPVTGLGWYHCPHGGPFAGYVHVKG